MNISEGYRHLCNTLYALYERREAEHIAGMVMEYITGLQKMDRLLQKDALLTTEQAGKLHNYTALLLQHQPIQYVLQEAWFYGMPLYVDQHVLIPRPETEELVEWIIKDQTSSKPQPNIIDIGTGSGAIAVALKKNIPGADVWAVDISAEALHTATKNAALQQTPVTFSKADILQPGSIESFPFFDIIVSNPPYIPDSDKKEMSPNVLQHEPHIALFVEDENPLIFYAAIADFALLHLQKNGSVYVEIHEGMGEAVKDLFIQKGFMNVIIKKDMHGKDRMVKAVNRQ